MATTPTAPREPDGVRRDLARCSDVSICDLSGAEQFLVWAIRWRTSAQDDAAIKYRRMYKMCTMYRFISVDFSSLSCPLFSTSLL